MLLSIAANAAATSEPDPLISIALLTVIVPVFVVLIDVISVAVIFTSPASLIVTVPVCSVIVPAKAALIFATVPLIATPAFARTIAPSVAALIALS